MDGEDRTKEGCGQASLKSMRRSSYDRLIVQSKRFKGFGRRVENVIAQDEAS